MAIDLQKHEHNLRDRMHHGRLDLRRRQEQALLDPESAAPMDPLVRIVYADVGGIGLLGYHFREVPRHVNWTHSAQIAMCRLFTRPWPIRNDKRATVEANLVLPVLQVRRDALAVEGLEFEGPLQGLSGREIAFFVVADLVAEGTFHGQLILQA